MYPLMPLQIVIPVKRLRTLVALERPVLIHTAPTRPPTPCPALAVPAAAVRHPVGKGLAVPEVLGVVAAARDERHGRAGLVEVGHDGAVVRGRMVVVGVHVEGAGEGAGPGFLLGLGGLLGGRAGAGLRGRGWVQMRWWGAHAGEAAEGGEARAGVVVTGTRAGAGELGAWVGGVGRGDDGGGAVGGGGRRGGGDGGGWLRWREGRKGGLLGGGGGGRVVVPRGRRLAVAGVARELLVRGGGGREGLGAGGVVVGPGCSRLLPRRCTTCVAISRGRRRGLSSSSGKGVGADGRQELLKRRRRVDLGQLLVGLLLLGAWWVVGAVGARHPPQRSRP